MRYRSRLPRQLVGWSCVAISAVIVNVLIHPSAQSSQPMTGIAPDFNLKPYMDGLDFYKPSQNNLAIFAPLGVIDPKTLGGFIAIEVDYQKMEPVQAGEGLAMVDQLFRYRKSFLVHPSVLAAMQQDPNIKDDAARDEYLMTHGGMLHSFNGRPSQVKADAENNIIERCWTARGLFAREKNMPVIETSQGLEWRNEGGQFHRMGMSAIIAANYLAWYENGRLHRGDGPAVVRSDKIEYWWRGEKCTPQQFEQLQLQEAKRKLERRTRDRT
ncbi:MAG: hypothetical protein EYC62_08095 [Alphaproteobacteria bacterium]|nr:MAG: hypothetical protein EYC62_08095 [Alphaproteobacteria bacterium]